MAKNIVKQSVAYSYILSQPFATYIDAYPMLQSQWLAEQDIQHIAYGDHSQVVRVIQHKLNNLKYYDEAIDGEYGLFTEYALKNSKLITKLFLMDQLIGKQLTQLLMSSKAII